jgi:pimeloyl-ACP methyl ester carboxylesterase
MQHEHPGRKFVLIADDWGSGIASHYAAQHNDRLLALIQFDAIAFDGYPSTRSKRSAAPRKFRTRPKATKCSRWPSAHLTRHWYRS